MDDGDLPDGDGRWRRWVSLRRGDSAGSAQPRPHLERRRLGCAAAGDPLLDSGVVGVATGRDGAARSRASLGTIRQSWPPAWSLHRLRAGRGRPSKWLRGWATCSAPWRPRPSTSSTSGATPSRATACRRTLSAWLAGLRPRPDAAAAHREHDVTRPGQPRGSPPFPGLGEPEPAAGSRSRPSASGRKKSRRGFPSQGAPPGSLGSFERLLARRRCRGRISGGRRRWRWCRGWRAPAYRRRKPPENQQSRHRRARRAAIIAMPSS